MDFKEAIDMQTLNAFDSQISLWYEHCGKRPPSQAYVSRLVKSHMLNMSIEQVKSAVDQAMIDDARVTQLPQYLKAEKNKSGDREERETRANNMFEKWFNFYEGHGHGLIVAHAMAARAYVETINGREFRKEQWELFQPLQKLELEEVKSVPVTVKDGQIILPEKVIQDVVPQEDEQEKLAESKARFEEQKRALENRRLLTDIEPISEDEELDILFGDL